MKNLEKECLDRLNLILSKFDLKIDIVHITSLNVCQYRLFDNFLYKTPYSNWLCLWLSISDILMHSNSIFKCLNSYNFIIRTKKFKFSSHYMPVKTYTSYQRYSEAYNIIKHLENVSCLEEFIIRCDLIGI